MLPQEREHNNNNNIINYITYYLGGEKREGERKEEKRRFDKKRWPGSARIEVCTSRSLLPQEREHRRRGEKEIRREKGGEKTVLIR